LSRGAKIYAEICGYGLSNDAYHATAPDPEGSGIYVSIKNAIKNAGIDKSKVGYINTHGTGTQANDASELTGLRNFFGDELFQKIYVSSSKGYFGHNLGAAASIEYVTTLLALENGKLPATVNFEEPRPGCEYGNIITNKMIDHMPDYFICNNSAFGGHNSSIVSSALPLKDEGSYNEPTGRTRVGIIGIGAINEYGCYQHGISKELSITNNPKPIVDFSLKSYDKNLYERRMNKLSQFSIGAADLAIKDSGVRDINPEEIGLIFGTAFGSLDSTSKYLGSIFEKGPQFASGIHFPDMVLNSTAGRVSNKLNIRSYGSSISTGGNDGAIATLIGYELIKNKSLDYCLVGAGDEDSDLSQELAETFNLNASQFKLTEGSSFLMLSDIDKAIEQGCLVYAEINGFGMSSIGNEDRANAEWIKKAVKVAFDNSSITKADVDLVLFNSMGLEDDLIYEEILRKDIFTDFLVPIRTFNDTLGYAVSTSSLNQFLIGADLLYQNSLNDHIEEEIRNILVISSSINGSNIAGIISRFTK
jgi:3-oxoacyl-[acyl-carrier-protein] synthase II